MLTQLEPGRSIRASEVVKHERNVPVKNNFVLDTVGIFQGPNGPMLRTQRSDFWLNFDPFFLTFFPPSPHIPRFLAPTSKTPIRCQTWPKTVPNCPKVGRPVPRKGRKIDFQHDPIFAPPPRKWKNTGFSNDKGSPLSQRSICATDRLTSQHFRYGQISCMFCLLELQVPVGHPCRGGQWREGPFQHL